MQKYLIMPSYHSHHWYMFNLIKQLMYVWGRTSIVVYSCPFYKDRSTMNDQKSCWKLCAIQFFVDFTILSFRMINELCVFCFSTPCLAISVSKTQEIEEETPNCPCISGRIVVFSWKIKVQIFLKNVKTRIIQNPEEVSISWAGKGLVSFF